MWESRVLRRAFERLELHEGKLSRAVLRGGGGGDVTSLPDVWVGNHPGLPGQSSRFLHIYRRLATSWDKLGGLSAEGCLWLRPELTTIKVRSPSQRKSEGANHVPSSARGIDGKVLG